MSCSAFEYLTHACAPVEKYKTLGDLGTGDHRIDSFRLIKTRFGMSLAVVIARQTFFLPPRFSKDLKSQEKVDELNTFEYIMTYDGLLKGEHVLHFREARRFPSAHMEC